MSKKMIFNDVCDTALCRIANGDTEALAIIYQRLGRQIYMVAYSILQDVHAAEDVMQETFVRIISGAKFYQKGTNAKAYILKIAHNLSLTALQKRGWEIPTDLPNTQRSTDGEELPLTSLEALSLLSPEERQIVILKLDSNEKHKNIAALLGISPAACQKRYRRALEKLKPYYQDEYRKETL